MSATCSDHSCDPPLTELLQLLVRHSFRWLVPTLLVGAAAGAYAWHRPDIWSATQGIVVRDAAWIQDDAAGTFRLQDPMKTAQETIHEFARGPGVLMPVLKAVGPPPSRTDRAPWPDSRALEQLRDRMSLEPPKGAEYGTTEVLYLKVKDEDPDRATALAVAIYSGLRREVARLRDARLQGQIREVETLLRIREDELREATTSLTNLEREAGGELAELRMLHASASNNGELVNTISTAENELTRLRAEQHDRKALLKLLQLARENPQLLFAAPSALLESLPALAQLTAGLSASKLQTASLVGTHAADHPRYLGALKQEQAIREKIFDELESAVAITEANLALVDGRVELLEQQLGRLRARMDRLASLRAQYSNLVDQVDARRSAYEQARQQLGTLHARKIVDDEGRIMQSLHPPAISTRPLGPSRAVIALVGVLGGITLGLGIVLLTASPEPRANEESFAQTQGAAPPSSSGPLEGSSPFSTTRSRRRPPPRVARSRTQPLAAGAPDS